MDAKTQTIYEELIEAARNNRTCFYGELSELIGLPPMSPRFFVSLIQSTNMKTKMRDLYCPHWL